MKVIYILLLLLIAALVSGCVDKKEQNISTVPPSEIVDKKEQNLSNTSTGEVLPESYISGIEGNLTQIESMLNEKEENFSTGISESAFN
ncbi:MAG: hypothetical protein PHU34_11070 [Candidatus Methanoperedens sp.]|nr:hypothetical protein [Candidatus Methanoperedens sp.]